MSESTQQDTDSHFNSTYTTRHVYTRHIATWSISIAIKL